MHVLYYNSIPFLDALSLCACFVFPLSRVRKEKEKRYASNTWFDKTDRVEIKSSFLGFEDPLLSRKEINKYAGREERILILRFTQISRGIIEFR